MTHVGRVDACPGILELHAAADGQLARVRVPGGFLSAAALEVLGSLVASCATGWVELTSRGNLGVRAVSDVDGLQTGLAAAGLLPADASHDRARNIIASPLTGFSGAVDARPLVSELDAGLRAAPELAGLSGRFLFGIDDGWQLTLDGWLAGPATVSDVLVAAAGFLALRGDDVGVWRVRELPGGAPVLAAALDRPLGAHRCAVGERLTLGERYVGQRRLLIVGGWLQRLSAGQLAALASVLMPGEVIRLAAAGRIVVPVDSSTAAATLGAAGLLVDADDPRGQVTACSGLGACARATVDVRQLAVGFAAAGVEPVHVVSCARACGAPADARVEVRWL